MKLTHELDVRLMTSVNMTVIRTGLTRCQCKHVCLPGCTWPHGANPCDLMDLGSLDNLLHTKGAQPAAREREAPRRPEPAGEPRADEGLQSAGPARAAARQPVRDAADRDAAESQTRIAPQTRPGLLPESTAQPVQPPNGQSYGDRRHAGGGRVRFPADGSAAAPHEREPAREPARIGATRTRTYSVRTSYSNASSQSSTSVRGHSARCLPPPGGQRSPGPR